MQRLALAALAVWATLSGTNARAADVLRKIVAEVDPIAPASASYEASQDHVSTSKWGGNVDFNFGGVLSTGPELWVGNFTAKGTTDPNQTYRREDLWPGEEEKLDAIRLRWNVTRWEQPQSMRGWYVKGGYSYMRINSKSSKYAESAGKGDAVPTPVPGQTSVGDPSLITDIRHGAVVGFGNRWMFHDQSLSATLGTSFTATFKRTVSVDAKDQNALADYNQEIADLPDTRMATRPTPEINLALGYAW